MARTASRTQRVQDRRTLEVCDALGRIIEYWGFRAIHGRVWTLLALRAVALPQVEIAHSLGVSRAAVSGAIATLERYSLVRAAGEGRKAPYVANMDIWPAIAAVYREREWMLLETARLSLEAALEEARIAGRRGAGALSYDTARVELLLALTRQAQAFLQIIMALRMPRSLDGLGRVITRAAGVIRNLRGG